VAQGSGAACARLQGSAAGEEMGSLTWEEEEEEEGEGEEEEEEEEELYLRFETRAGV